MSKAPSTLPPASGDKTVHKSNRIQVSNQKQPIRFYVNLAKKMLRNNEPDVELSGLGNAIQTVVTCVEILKNADLVTVTKIESSSVQIGQNKRLKPKIQVFVVKSKNFDKIMDQQEKEQAAKKAEAEKNAAAAATTTTTTTTPAPTPAAK